MPIAGPPAVFIVRRVVKVIAKELDWSPGTVWFVSTVAAGMTAGVVGVVTLPVTGGVDGATGAVTTVIDAIVDTFVDPDMRDAVWGAIKAMGSPGDDGTYAWSP